MSTALVVGIAVFAAGVLLRLGVAKPLQEAQRRHDTRSPRNWLWTASPHPEVERWRRLAALGIALAWIGAIVAILNPAL